MFQRQENNLATCFQGNAKILVHLWRPLLWYFEGIFIPLICSQCLQRQSMWRILNNQICRRKKSELSYAFEWMIYPQGTSKHTRWASIPPNCLCYIMPCAAANYISCQCFLWYWYHCVRISIFVWDLLFLYIYNLDFDLMRFCY